MSSVESATMVASAFLRAIGSRIGPGKLVAAALAMFALVYGGALGIVTPLWLSPSATKLALAVEMAVVGVALVLAMLSADEAVDRGAPRVVTYAVAVIGASAIGALLGFELRAALGIAFLPADANDVLPDVQPYFHRLDLALIGTLMGGLVAFAHANHRTALTARARQHDAEQARARAARRTLESQLQALQARVEPMFLFGTLERIRQLYRSDAVAAGGMLEDLIVYLRAALPHLRESSSTVAKELSLARAWLDIVGRSVADRQLELDIAESSREARLPALVLLPLIQHAAGSVDARALRLRLHIGAAAARLSIHVSTSTGAFAAGIEGQPLLEQIDIRLRGIYGEAARIGCRRFADAAGSGIDIELPLETDAQPEARPSPGPSFARASGTRRR